MQVYLPSTIRSRLQFDLNNKYKSTLFVLRIINQVLNYSINIVPGLHVNVHE